MSDPYGNLAGSFNDLTRNLLAMKGQQVQQALSQAELGMRERGLNETTRQHNVGAWGTETAPAPGTPTLAARQVQAAEEANKIKAAATPHLQNFDSISAGMITNQLSKFGVTDKDLTDTIKTMGSTPGVTKQQAMQEILGKYPNYRQKLIDDSVATLMKNSEKDPNYVNTPQGQAHQAFINSLDSDTTGKGILANTAVFGPVVRALDMEDAAARLKANANDLVKVQGPDGRPMFVPAGQAAGMQPFVEDKTPNQIELTARTLSGDKSAKAVLDAMQAREMALVTARNNSSKERADRQFAVTLRKEFNNLPDVKEYNQTIPKIKSMQAAYGEAQKTKNFVAVDQALITLYNKLTDPTSVVRESEYARTAENIPLLNRIKGKVEKIKSGGAGLTEEERRALMDMATLMYRGYEDVRSRRLSEYRQYGVMGGLEENFLADSVSGSVRGEKNPAPGGPSPAAPTVIKYDAKGNRKP